MSLDPTKTTKILCVCQKGCSRSVGTKYRLNRRGYGNVVAIGHQTATPELLMLLCEWADIILIAEGKMAEFLPEQFRSKIEPRFEIGRDRWGAWAASEMQNIIKNQLNALGMR